MNISGAAAVSDTIAEEIIDPGFRAKQLPAYLTGVRSLLFGVRPDRAMLNYRCAQLLAVAHSTPLEEYLLALDPRITYDWQETLPVGRELFTPTVTKLAGSDAAHLFTYGDGTPPDATGRMRHQFRVTATTSSTCEIHRQTTPPSKTLSTFATDQRLALSDSGVEFRMDQAEDGQDWLIEFLVRPSRGLPEIAASIARIGEPAMLSLFGFTAEEPYRTFRELWYRKLELPLKLAALVCAVVYRSEEAA